MKPSQEISSLQLQVRDLKKTNSTNVASEYSNSYGVLYCVVLNHAARLILRAK